MERTIYLTHRQATTTAPISTASYSIAASSSLGFHFLTSHCSVFQAKSTDLTVTKSHCFGRQMICATLLEWLYLSSQLLPEIILSRTFKCCFCRNQLFHLFSQELQQYFDLSSLSLFALWYWLGLTLAGTLEGVAECQQSSLVRLLRLLQSTFCSNLDSGQKVKSSSMD